MQCNLNKKGIGAACNFPKKLRKELNLAWFRLDCDIDASMVDNRMVQSHEGWITEVHKWEMQLILFPFKAITLNLMPQKRSMVGLHQGCIGRKGSPDGGKSRGGRVIWWKWKVQAAHSFVGIANNFHFAITEALKSMKSPSMSLYYSFWDIRVLFLGVDWCLSFF